MDSTSICDGICLASFMHWYRVLNKEEHSSKISDSGRTVSSKVRSQAFFGRINFVYRVFSCAKLLQQQTDSPCIVFTLQFNFEHVLISFEPKFKISQ
ncbi:unnamed protein product, partial [Dicrocoelium dendriticum]